MAFKYLVNLVHRTFKCGKRLLGLCGQPNLDKHIKLQADLAIVEPGNIALDRAILFQRLDPAMTGRRRQAYFFRQKIQRLLTVLLHVGQNGDINSVHRLFSFNIAISSNILVP
jgi:hypothetical protein